MKADVGIVGLGTIGGAFLLNLAEKGFSVVGYDTQTSKYSWLLNEKSSEMNFHLSEKLDDFVAQLAKPRKILLFVPSNAVDEAVASILPYLDEEDILVDAGNSHFIETERRIAQLNTCGIEFVGVGVSGGFEGARKGASIMSGGSEDAYRKLKPIFEATAAKVDGISCQAHVGSGAAGHFVKMVHNGIEYAVMELIAETYLILKEAFGLENVQIAEQFERWNEGKLGAFLMQITPQVLRKTEGEQDLIELISDAAEQKGTGRWTVQIASEFGVPVPTIEAAVWMRSLSSSESTRKILNEVLPKPKNSRLSLENNFLDCLEEALFAGFVVAYSQGFSLIKTVSEKKGYGCNLAKIAEIWRGGCIIRSKLLADICDAFQKNPNLESLLADARISEMMKIDSLKAICILAHEAELPVMAFSASLNYLNAYRHRRLPTNLIQAQRDFFGAHGYRRIDRDGIFHSSW